MCKEIKNMIIKAKLKKLNELLRKAKNKER